MPTKSLILELDIETGSQANLPYVRNKKPKTLKQYSTPPLYEFVAWTNAFGNTDAAARKTVRSYAMRHCKLRQDQSNHPCGVHHYSGSFVGRNSNSRNNSEILEDQFKIFLAMMPHEVLTLDPFDCLPVRTQPYMLELFGKCKHLRYFSRITTDSAMSTKRYDLHL